MPLVISDEELQKLGMTEKELRVELACRLFDIGKLPLWPAAQLAGMTRGEFEDELMGRKIPAYRVTEEDFLSDMETLKRLGF